MCPATVDDVFVPDPDAVADSDTKVSAVWSAYPNLPANGTARSKDKIFAVLFDVFGHRRNHATKLSADRADSC